MNGEQRIRAALTRIMSDGEANACQVFKGFANAGATEATGWHYRPLGEQPVYLGSTVAQALEAIREIGNSREKPPGWGGKRTPGPGKRNGRPARPDRRGRHLITIAATRKEMEVILVSMSTDERRETLLAAVANNKGTYARFSELEPGDVFWWVDSKEATTGKPEWKMMSYGKEMWSVPVVHEDGQPGSIEFPDGNELVQLVQP